jgi:integrase
MSKPTRRKRNKLWSVTRIRHPAHPGLLLRITELEPGGDLYAVRMEQGKQRMVKLYREGPSGELLQCRRTDLGSTAREQTDGARAMAYELIEELASTGGTLRAGSTSGPAASPGEVVTLERLVDMYEAHGLHGRSEQYRQEQPAKIRRLIAILDAADRDVRSLCRSDVEQYTARRRAEGMRQGTIASALSALKIALNWATEHRRVDGSPVLEHNPIARLRIRREPQPRRPRADEPRYLALRAVADQLPDGFSTALDLVWGTGRRISAVLSLRWGDVILDPATAARMASELDDGIAWTAADFPHGGVRWYTGRRTTNKTQEQVRPLNGLARAALDRARPDICPAETWVFPAPTDAARRLGYFVAKKWLHRAENLAKLPHVRGGGWHAFRRGWATARKHHPLADVAMIGGWRDVTTLRDCYVQPDVATMRAIVNGD